MTDLNQIDQQMTIESTLYIIDKIRPEIEAGNFMGIFRYTERLYFLVKFAAIVQKRNRELAELKIYISDNEEIK